MAKKSIEDIIGKASKRESDVLKDEMLRSNIESDMTYFFEKILNKKIPSFKKGKGFVTSRRRDFSRTKGHREWGAIDIGAAGIGSVKDQQKFIDYMLDRGYRIIDETKAVSQARGEFNRGIFHIDSHPSEKGILRQEVPVKKSGEGSREFRTHGAYPIVKPGEESQAGFIAPLTTRVKKSVKISKPKIQYDLSNPFRIPEDKSKVQSWMKKHKYKANDLKKPDGSWYNPGDVLPSPEEVEVETKEEIVRDPYYGTEVDMPKPEISPEQMPLDPPTPYGVYAQDQPEFEEAEKVQMWAADGGEVELKDSWREEEVEEDYDIPEYLQRPEDKVEEPLIPNVPEVKGFVPVEPPPVEPPPVEPPPVPPPPLPPPPLPLSLLLFLLRACAA